MWSGDWAQPGHGWLCRLELEVLSYAEFCFVRGADLVKLFQAAADFGGIIFRNLLLLVASVLNFQNIERL